MKKLSLGILLTVSTSILSVTFLSMTSAFAELSADAGPDQAFNDTDGNGIEFVTLNAAGSSAGQHGIIAYDWQKDGVSLASGVTSLVPFALGSHTITLIITDESGDFASDEVIIDIRDPQTSPTLPLPPELDTWEANMLTYGEKHGKALIELLKDPDVDPSVAATEYDAIRVFREIGRYTDDSKWNAYLVAAVKAYRDQYVLPLKGDVPGYWNFTEGLRLHYQFTYDQKSRDAIILLSENAAYAADSTPLEQTVPSDFSREVAYAINSYLDAELVGAPRRDRLDDLFNQALGHLDQFLAAGDTTDYAPFMFALTAEALIRYHSQVEDNPRIVTKIAALADWTWNNAWVAADEAFWYRANDPSQGAADLNLLIAPVYAWLFQQTGKLNYRDQADQIFAGGVKGAGLDEARQFNQNYCYSFEYVRWRGSDAGSNPPVLSMAGSRYLNAQIDTSVRLTFTARDPNGDALSLSVAPNDFAALNMNRDGSYSLILEPKSAHLGTHAITLTATDTQGWASSIALTVVVSAENTSPASGSTRYVAITGSDTSGDGSAENPWASITHATAHCSDGDLILVKPGTYSGTQRLQGQWATGITVRSEIPYQAKLRNNKLVVRCWYGQNIVFEGFDLAHDGPDADPVVMQVQNYNDASNPVQNIVIRNNIFHDSYNNDLLRVMNGAINVTVEGNMFYNQYGGHQHIDINSVEGVVVQDNIFFNDFASSGRLPPVRAVLFW